MYSYKNIQGGRPLRNVSTQIVSVVTGLFFSAAVSIGFAGGSIDVSHEQVVNADAAAVWEKIGNFGTIHEWHPAIDSTEMEGDGMTVGETRLLTLGDGGKIDEELLAFDADGMSLSYAITNSPLPIKDYESVLAVQDMGDGTSKVSWSASMNSNGVSDEEAHDIIMGVYSAGLTALSEMF